MELFICGCVALMATLVYKVPTLPMWYVYVPQVFALGFVIGGLRHKHFVLGLGDRKKHPKYTVIMLKMLPVLGLLWYYEFWGSLVLGFVILGFKMLRDATPYMFKVTVAGAECWAVAMGLEFVSSGGSSTQEVVFSLYSMDGTRNIVLESLLSDMDKAYIKRRFEESYTITAMKSSFGG